MIKVVETQLLTIIRFVLLLLASIVIMSETSSSKCSIKLAIGSKNPVKITSAIAGVKRALAPVMESSLEVQGEGFNIPSGVSDQPMGDGETETGSINRAKGAFEAYQTAYNMPPDYSVGLEGGIVVTDKEMICSAYMCVFNGKDHHTARTCSFALPPAIKELVESGMELGDADDQIFGSTNSKQKGGTVGHLTRGVIDRNNYYIDAVTLATMPFLWEDLWPSSK